MHAGALYVRRRRWKKSSAKVLRGDALGLRPGERRAGSVRCVARLRAPPLRPSPPERHTYQCPVSQALQGIGYTEDRGASCVLECQGTYKYQHDTDKDLKFIHVFPRVDTSAAEANASGEAAAAAEASRAANPEWSCLTLGLDQFKKTVEKKVASFQQKQTLLRLLKQTAQQVAEFEERISSRGTLSDEEQKLYDNAVDLQDKARRGEIDWNDREAETVCAGTED